MGTVEAGTLRRSTSKSTGKAKVSRRDSEEEKVITQKNPTNRWDFFLGTIGVYAGALGRG